MAQAKTASKNNPDSRGEGAKKRKFKGKIVLPVLFIGGGRKYMAAAYESGELVIDPATKLPIPHANI